MVLNFSTKLFCREPEAGDWMMPEGVTGSAEPKMLPVRKTASTVAAIAVAVVRGLPV